MSPWLKFFYIVWWVIENLLVIFVFLPLWLVLVLVLLILTLPYTLYYPSSNFSMMSADMPPVQLYLNHFESLYPELIASVAAAHRLKRKGRPPGIKFWPRKTDRYFLPMVFVTITSTHWTFSQSAGLFARLEATQIWDRRVLWAFLRDKVEQAGLVNEAEKAAFAAVMEKMCSHRLRDALAKLAVLTGLNGTKGKPNERNRSMPMGMPVVPVGNDSMEWILQKGAFLVPNETVQPRLSSLHQLIRFNMWGGFKKDADLENGLGGYWQIFDMRKTYPWED